MGTFEFHSGLHFETCYYQAIEYCIAHKIKTFEGVRAANINWRAAFCPLLRAPPIGLRMRSLRKQWNII